MSTSYGDKYDRRQTERLSDELTQLHDQLFSRIRELEAEVARLKDSKADAEQDAIYNKLRLKAIQDGS